MKEEKTDKFPRLLICEGYKDAAFFHNFIEQNKLPRFHIRFSEGKDRIEQTLRAYIIEAKSNWPSIGHVLVVGDCDDAPKERFDSLVTQINNVPGLSAASEPMKRSTSKPSCTVMMMPSTNDDGTLESLVLEAAKSVSGQNAGAVSDFLAAVNADKWKNRSGNSDQVRQDKAWLRTWLAIRCSDPFVPLGSAFCDKRYQDAIPLTHKSLKPLADFLTSFEKANASD